MEHLFLSRLLRLYLSKRIDDGIMGKASEIKIFKWRGNTGNPPLEAAMEDKFLTTVTDKLKERILHLDEEIVEGQKDIEGMHEYYWENYTEMDEYGYENYDNQQALLGRVNANNEKIHLRQRFVKMLDSPYFGRVDFIYDGEDEEWPFYIGLGNFSDRTGGTPLIYDWRAPVSSLFYDYDRGPAFYMAPGGKTEGNIRAKWQYKIRGGKMIYAFESDIKIDDDILKQELGANGDVQLKNIVRTIQKEQNAIIRNRLDKILVIQGAAGSGKTSIALHRIAYLLYHEREYLRSSNILILSPNGVFSDYISHILPELGEEHIQEMSFDLFAYRELLEVAADCEDKYHQIEKQIREGKKKSDHEKKQSQGFVGEMEGFLAMLEDELMDFHEITYKSMKKTEEELIRLFYFKFQDIPLLLRMEAVADYVIDEYETLHDRTLPEEEREKVTEKFRSLYMTRDLYEIYNQFLCTYGYASLPDVPVKERILEYEDVYPMLYLKYRLLGNKAHANIRHLVIDEMQDYSYLQYVILGKLFQCRMTILGDRAQTMDERQADVTTFLPKIFGKDIRTIVINKSYRNTIEIAEYAAKLSGITGIEFLKRHGKPVEEERFFEFKEALKRIEERSRNSETYETCAVITFTEEEALQIYRFLKDCGQEVSYMDRDSSSFQKGITVTTFYMAKGLEFDQVFGLFPAKEDALTRQAEYICATRALHELYMYQYEEKAGNDQ